MWFANIAFAAAVGCSTPSNPDVVTMDARDVSADLALDSRPDGRIPFDVTDTPDAIDSAPPRDVTDAADVTDSAPPRDVADVTDTGPSQCVRNGGACVPGTRQTSGFRVTCAPGSALNDGAQTVFSGGLNIVMMYGDGCGYTGSPGGGGEGAPLACCYPISDAGSDASTDAVTDVASDTGATRGDAGEGAECTSKSECADGLLCCYPCGIPGCMNRCTAVAPGGSCPLLP